MPDKAPKSAFRNRLTSKIYMLTIFRPTFSFIFRPMFSFIFRQCNQYRNQCRNSFSQTYPLWKDSISCSSSTNIRPRSWWSGAKVTSVYISALHFILALGVTFFLFLFFESYIYFYFVFLKVTFNCLGKSSALYFPPKGRK